MTTAEYVQSVNTRYRLGRAWSFRIGGGQPAPKQRKGRVFDFEDIMNYQQIIEVLAENMIDREMLI